MVVAAVLLLSRTSESGKRGIARPTPHTARVPSARPPVSALPVRRAASAVSPVGGRDRDAGARPPRAGPPRAAVSAILIPVSCLELQRRGVRRSPGRAARSASSVVLRRVSNRQS